MIKAFKDPFGGIKGDQTFKSSSPFKIDKEQALKDIQNSIAKWKGKDKKKSSFFSKILKIKDLQNDSKASHWEYSDTNRQLINIHLFWSGRKIKTLYEVPKKKVLKTLNKIKIFYKNISGIRPDISNQLILDCYNQTAKNYNLPKKKISFKDQIEVKSFDPFEGLEGKTKKILNNDLFKDKKIALKEINLSIKIFNENFSKKKIDQNLRRKPKNFSQNFKTSPDHFEVYLYWGGILIREIKRVSQNKTKDALFSLKEFIENFDTQNPNLKDPLIKKMYLASKEKYRPKNKKQKLLSINEGGMSYWSYKQHKWIMGKFDAKNNKFIPPKKNL